MSDDIEWKIEISSRLAAIEATLSRVEKQVVATNGRTTALELVNAVSASETATKHSFWGVFWGLFGSIFGAIIGAAAVLFAHSK